MYTYQESLDQIETLIDRHGLETVLQMITFVCQEKADHIMVSYSDESLARAWQANGRLVQRIELKPV